MECRFLASSLFWSLSGLRPSSPLDVGKGPEVAEMSRGASLPAGKTASKGFPRPGQGLPLSITGHRRRWNECPLIAKRCYEAEGPGLMLLR